MINPVMIPANLTTPKTLGDHQQLFALLIAHLILYAYDHGYQIRCGDFFRGDGAGHKTNSCHYIKLAADLNLFLDGKFLDKTPDHKILGDYWITLHTLCRWGGRYGDGNHYSLVYQGRE